MLNGTSHDAWQTLISQTEQKDNKQHEQNTVRLQFFQVMCLGLAVTVIK